MAAAPGYDGVNLAQAYAQRAQVDAHRSLGPMLEPGYTQEFDNESEDNFTTRGEAWSDLLSCLTSPLLRLGFLLQLLVLIFGFALYYGHGGTGVFTFDLFSTPEQLRTSEAYSTIMILLETIFLVGCVCISTFQIYVADNSKTTRGFRAGSKLLSTAATLDSFVVALRLMQYIYAYHFLGSRWWMKYTQSSTDWCIFYAGGFVHAISLVLYGMAIFYMEAYHDEGTYEEWSWICLLLFFIAGAFEFTLVFSGLGAFYTVLHIAALVVAVLWSFSFEPLLHYHSPVFHDRDLNGDLPIGKEEMEDYNANPSTNPTVQNAYAYVGQ